MRPRDLVELVAVAFFLVVGTWLLFIIASSALEG